MVRVIEMKFNHSDFHSLVPPEAIGKIVGVSGRTVLNWEAAGIITAEIRVGKVVRFDPPKVLQQLQEKSSQRKASAPAEQESKPIN